MKTPRLNGCVLGLALLIPVVASASTIRHDRSQSDYLSVGDFFTSVGRVNGVGTDPKTGQTINYIASGTLISPNWVLTAGHVVDIAQSLNFTVGGRTITADRWVPHPNWTGNVVSGYDIGLFKLHESVTDIAPVTLYTGSSELGRIGTFVGYGMTGTGLTGATIFDGLKRGSQNNLDRFYDSAKRIFMVDFDNPSPYAYFDNLVGSKTPLYIEGLIAPGDSGGPVFMSEGTGRVVVGVNSFLGANFFDGKPDSDYGDYAGATRVSPFTSWIDSVLYGTYAPTGAKLHDKSPANLTTAIAIVPEPAAVALLAGILFGLRRRHVR